MRYGILAIVGIILLLFMPFQIEQRFDVKEMMKDYPWVRFAMSKKNPRELHFLSQIERMTEKDPTLGRDVAELPWMRDYILREEGEALDTIVRITDIDKNLAKSTVQAFWFKDYITERKVEFLNLFLNLTEEDTELARNISKTRWFSIFIGSEELEATRMLSEMDPKFAERISECVWFSDDMMEADIRAMGQFEILFKNDKERAEEILDFFDPKSDLENLEAMNRMFEEDNASYRQFFSTNALTSQTLSSAVSLFRLKRLDPQFSEMVSKEDANNLVYIESIANRNLDAARLVYTGFGGDETVLRFASKYFSYKNMDDTSNLFQSCLFVSRNPEFVYEDGLESYRYDLLVEVFSSLEASDIYKYKSLLLVAINVYAERFYDWNDPLHGRLYGWSSDGKLSDLEKDGFVSLLSYLIEENERGGLVTNIRLENESYLKALISVPYEFLVNYDGTIVKSVGEEKGTHYVYAIVYNIKTLPTRKRNLNENLSGIGVEYRNLLVDYILSNGEKKDVYYILINAKNWDVAGRRDEKACVYQTYQTLMDAIALGIAPTTIYWKSKETGHIYPSYIASPSLLLAIEQNSPYWGNPFVYKGYISPYDDTGYKKSLGRDIEYVSIYNHDAGNFVTIYSIVNDNPLVQPATFVFILFSVIIFCISIWILKKK